MGDVDPLRNGNLGGIWECPECGAPVETDLWTMGRDIPAHFEEDHPRLFEELDLGNFGLWPDEAL